MLPSVQINKSVEYIELARNGRDTSVILKEAKATRTDTDMVSQMRFDCKLAHQDQVCRLGGFSSASELHESLSKAFSLPADQILYCTLNTHNPRDMTALLGNYLSLGDLIVVQLCGNEREVKLTKSQEHLGLTITDNGHGRAFVKRVKAMDSKVEQSIRPGDHIAAINGESTLGMRHYEVARAIREIPVQKTFTLKIVEPLNAEENSSSSMLTKSFQNHGETEKSLSVANQNIFQLDTCNSDDSIEVSLPIDRLLSRSANRKSFGDPIHQLNSQTDHSKRDNPYRQALKDINTILESFLGINDDTLAIQIYRLSSENSHSFEAFQEAVDGGELNIFSFGHDIKKKLWQCVNSVDK